MLLKTIAARRAVLGDEEDKEDEVKKEELTLLEELSEMQQLEDVLRDNLRSKDSVLGFFENLEANREKSAAEGAIALTAWIAANEAQAKASQAWEGVKALAATVTGGDGSTAPPAPASFTGAIWNIASSMDKVMPIIGNLEESMAESLTNPALVVQLSDRRRKLRKKLIRKIAMVRNKIEGKPLPPPPMERSALQTLLAVGLETALGLGA